MNTEIQENLNKIAYKKTIPFCYGCYKEAPTGTCKSCHSDDLMRLLPSVGCEYGIEWVVESLISEALSAVDTDAAFTDFLDLTEDCYEQPVKIGFMEFDAVYVMKNMDKVSWDIACADYVSGQLEDGQLLTFDNGSTYYLATDIENFVDENIEDTEEAS